MKLGFTSLEIALIKWVWPLFREGYLMIAKQALAILGNHYLKKINYLKSLQFKKKLLLLMSVFT
jgi:hypothetical protein